MQPESAYWLLILAFTFILLLFINGVFILVESSLRRLRPGLLEEMASEGNEFAEKLLNEQPRWERYLRTTQYCRVLFVMVMGIFVALPLVRLLYDAIGSPFLATVIILISVAFFWLTFSILIPDGIARVKSERVAVTLLWFVRWIGWLLLPITSLANSIAEWIISKLGITREMQEEEAHSEEELRQIVSASQRGGIIDEVEEELIDNVLDFTDRLVREIIVPRQDMAVVYLDDPLEEQLKTIRTGGHTRFPLCIEDKDHIIGMLHIRDLLVELMTTSPQEVDLKSLQREILVVPEGMLVTELLNLMRTRQIHLAVVVDEYGGTAGLVALEDILEELVGEINDEHDSDILEEIVPLENGRYELDGRVILADAADLMNLQFEEEPEEDTIGGYVFRLLGHKPEEGDTVECQGWIFTVIDTEGFRILRILAAPPEQPSLEEETQDDFQ